MSDATAEIIEQLKKCIYIRDNGALLELLQQNPNINLSLKYDNEYLIHLALKSTPAILETLIRNGADVNAKYGDDDNTPLHVAVRDKRVGMVKTLLSNSADVNTKNKLGDTPLHIAVQRGHLPIGKELLRKDADGTFIWKVDIDQQNSKDESARSIINTKEDQWKDLIQTHSTSHQPDGDVQERNRIQDFTVTDGGLTGMDGNMYQVLMFLLICIKAKKEKNYDDYQIMTEIEQAGKLDDIVIRYLEDDEWHWRFIQLKHKNSKNSDKNKIKIQELKIKSSKLQLKEYIDCIIDILNDERFKEGIFEDGIICTTAILDKETESIFNDKTSEFQGDRLLYFNDANFKASFGQLNRKEFEERILTEQDAEWKIKNQSMLGEICEKMYFLTCYPNVFSLRELILKEFETLHNSNTELINDFLVNKCLDHILDAKGKPMNKSDIDELIEKFESHLRIQQCIGISNQNIKNRTLNFKDPLPQLEGFFDSNNTNLHLIINTQRVHLALMNVLNEIKTKKVKESDFLVFHSDNLHNENTRETILKSLKHLNGAICVFVKCRSFFEDISERNSNEKMIFIEEISFDNENDNKLRFDNLTEESQNNLIANINSWLIEKRQNIVANYIERNLTIELSRHEGAASNRIDTFDELKKLKTLKEEDLLETNNPSECQIIVVLGDPGIGKSSLLSNLKTEMEKKNHWVVLLNLNDFTLNKETQMFHLSKAEFSNDNKAAAVKFLIGMLKSSRQVREDEITPLLFDLIELSLLSDDDSSNLPRPVILLDSFDEISPYYEKNVFCLVEALKLTRASRIWLTTRPHENKKIADRLQSTNYTLAPFNVESKIKYLLNYCTSLKEEKRNDLTSFIRAGTNFYLLFRILIAKTKGMKDNFQSYKNQFLEIFDHSLEIEKNSIFEESFGHNFNNMLDNPLQFRMLLNLCMEPKELTGMTIAEMYERFIDSKFRILFKKDSYSDGGNALQISLRQLCEDQHYKFACNVIFPNKTKFFPLTSEFLSDIARVGLIAKHGEEFTFLHRSYAEFLAAKYLLRKNFLNHLDLMTEVLVEDSYRMLCTFLNDLLKNSEGPHKWPENSEYKEEKVWAHYANGENAIHSAAERGHTEIIKYLDEVISNADTFKNMLVAITLKGETIADKAGLAFNYEQLFSLFKDKLGEENFSILLQNSKLYIIRIIKTTSKSGTYEEMIKFFGSFCPADPIDKLLSTRNDNGNNIIHFAVLHNTLNDFMRLQCSTNIISTFKECVFQKSSDEENCLHYAAFKGNINEVISFLKEHFTDPEIIENLSLVNKNGDTVLQSAAFEGHFVDTANVLVDIMGQDKFKDFVIKNSSLGNNFFHLAELTGNVNEMVAFLKKHFTDSEIIENLSLVDENGQTLLHIAASSGDFTKTANVLVGIMDQDQFKDFLLKKNSSGNNCLHLAALTGSINEVISFLKQYFTDPEIIEHLLSVVDKYEETILHIAAFNGHFINTANVLIDIMGKVKFKEFALKKNNRGINCLNIAIKNYDHNEVILFLKKHYPNYREFFHR